MRAASAASSPYLMTSAASAREALHRFARGRTPDRHSSALPPPIPAWFSRSRRPGAGAAKPRVSRSSCLLPAHLQGIGVELFVRRSMFQPHLFQVHFKLFGDQHRDGGISGLTHLDIGHRQDDLSVATDADEGVRHKFIGATRLQLGRLRMANLGSASGHRRRPLRPAGTRAAKGHSTDGA